MKLKESIKKVRDVFGRDYFLNKNIVSVLADYGAFKSEPAARIIIRLLIAERTLEKYLKAISEIERNKIVKFFINNTGISERKACEILETFRSVFCEEQEKDKINNDNKIESKKSDLSSLQINSFNISTLPETSISTVSFLGIHFGSKYIDFKKAIMAKGGSVCDNDKSNKRFLLHNFLYGNRNLITICTYKYCHVVKKISIQQRLADKTIRENRLHLILELYLSKYGIPKEDGIWHVNNVRISVREEKCLYAEKINIEYLYLNSELMDYEKKEEERLKEEQKRIAQMKQMEEERKKREEELLAKKKKEEERKALLDDI